MEQEDIQQLSKKERREQRRQKRTDEQEKMKARRRAKRIMLWGGFALGIAFVLAGILFLVLRGGNSSENGASTTATVSGGDWVKGNPEARVTLIEYADFQCPACANYYPMVKSLSEEFMDSVAIALRHFPLRQIHKNADLASRAAEAAGLQEKFWEMHDKLFDRQNVWASSSDAKDLFFAYASEIGLDMERFAKDIESDAVKSAVDEDYKEGLKAGVNGTPTFFLNGSRIPNPSNYNELRTLIQNKLSETDVPTP